MVLRPAPAPDLPAFGTAFLRLSGRTHGYDPGFLVGVHPIQHHVTGASTPRTEIRLGARTRELLPRSRTHPRRLAAPGTLGSLIAGVTWSGPPSAMTYGEPPRTATQDGHPPRPSTPGVPVHQACRGAAGPGPWVSERYGRA
jgi:hypothetical protein